MQTAKGHHITNCSYRPFYRGIHLVIHLTEHTGKANSVSKVNKRSDVEGINMAFDAVAPAPSASYAPSKGGNSSQHSGTVTLSSAPAPRQSQRHKAAGGGILLKAVPTMTGLAGKRRR
ncbi:hypothetical protein BaRGS_00012553 [Batillaria attramentaria]|uniref:C2H2-type domain-containing protein n=1 Tax=Batillaria attramentaria TaxID=370345 RepID=A0ABD0LA89_9CAEN